MSAKATGIDQLEVEARGGVGHIVLNQPEKHNAISFEMWEGMTAAVERFESDPAVRVIVVSGAGGKAFSAGADISQFEEKRGTQDAIEVYNAAVKRAQQALKTAALPTIAKITGYCIGGGLGVALCCDLRVASPDSTFAIPAARLGLGYGYDGMKILTNLVGPSFAKEILYTARRFGAEEAFAMGLVNRVRPRESLDEWLDDYAERIAGNAPLTIRAAKANIDAAVLDPADRELERCQALVDACFASEDYQEGRKAFMEKRRPHFQGK